MQAAEKAPKRARGAPKPKAGKPPAAGRPGAAAARGSSASEDECAPRTRISSSLCFTPHGLDRVVLKGEHALRVPSRVEAARGRSASDNERPHVRHIGCFHVIK